VADDTRSAPRRGWRRRRYELAASSARRRCSSRPAAALLLTLLRSVVARAPPRPTTSRRYRISDNVNLPFRVIPVIEEQGKTRVVMNIKAIANFSNQLFATNVTFRIPVSGRAAAWSGMR
jgi:hypothetical protein